MLEPTEEERGEACWKSVQEDASHETFAFQYVRKHGNAKHIAVDDDDDVLCGKNIARGSGVATLTEEHISRIADAAAKKVIEAMGGILKSTLDSVLEVRGQMVVDAVLERITLELEKRFPAEIDRDDSWDPVGDIAREYTDYVENASKEQPKCAQQNATTTATTSNAATEKESSMVVALPKAAPRRLQLKRGVAGDAGEKKAGEEESGEDNEPITPIAGKV